MVGCGEWWCYGPWERLTLYILRRWADYGQAGADGEEYGGSMA